MTKQEALELVRKHGSLSAAQRASGIDRKTLRRIINGNQGGAMYAKRTDSNQSLIVKALRDTGHGVIDLSGVGKGCPDLLVGRGMSWVMVECKTDKGKLTPEQVIWHNEHRDHGPIVIARDPVQAVQDVSKAVVGKWRNKGAV